MKKNKNVCFDNICICLHSDEKECLPMHSSILWTMNRINSAHSNDNTCHHNTSSLICLKRLDSLNAHS